VLSFHVTLISVVLSVQDSSNVRQGHLHPPLCGVIVLRT
jgi:hypothetical protein